MNDKNLSEESKKRLENEYLNSLFVTKSADLNDDSDEKFADESDNSDLLMRAIQKEMRSIKPLPKGFQKEVKEKLMNRGGVSMNNNEKNDLRKSDIQTEKEFKQGTKDEKATFKTRFESKRKPGIKVLYVLAASLVIMFLSYPLMLFSMKSPNYKMNPSASGEMSSASDMSFEPMNQNQNPDGGTKGSGKLAQEEKRSGVGDSGSHSEAELQQLNDKKIIENFTIVINTEKFDSSRQKIESIAAQSEGFVSSFEVYSNEHREKGVKTRHAFISVKIPAEHSEKYLESIKGIGEIYSESKTMEDVTKEYKDIEIEIRNYEEAEQRYLALYQKAESIEDMLRVENEIARLRNLIDTGKATLMNYDYKVKYATFYLHLNEVLEIKPVVSVEPGMWERAKVGFVKGLNAVISGAQNIFVYLVSIIPALTVIMLSLVIVLFIASLIRKKYNKRAARLGDERGAVKKDVDILSSSDKQAE